MMPSVPLHDLTECGADTPVRASLTAGYGAGALARERSSIKRGAGIPAQARLFSARLRNNSFEGARLQARRNRVPKSGALAPEATCLSTLPLPSETRELRTL